MLTLIARAIRDDDGQDLVEYALLALFIGVAAALVIPAIAPKMLNAFGGWATGVYNLWVPNDPI